MWAICKSEQGLHLQNEDSYFVGIKAKDEEVLGMAVICDGVGGWDHGEVASAFVVRYIKQYFEDICEELDTQAMVHEIERIHQALQTYASEQGLRLGTTLSLLLFNKTSYSSLQVGDSRIYHICEACTQITKDQTLACYKRDQHLLDEEAFQQSHEHHILTQCMGMEKAICIVVQTGEIRDPTYFFLCSDGQYKHYEKDSFANVLQAFYGKDEEACRQYSSYLCHGAQAAGERDDITHIVLRLP